MTDKDATVASLEFSDPVSPKPEDVPLTFKEFAKELPRLAAEELTRQSISRNAFAKATGIPRKRLNRILSGKASLNVFEVLKLVRHFYPGWVDDAQQA